MIMPNKVNMFQSHIIKCEIIFKDCEIIGLMTGLTCITPAKRHTVNIWLLYMLGMQKVIILPGIKWFLGIDNFINYFYVWLLDYSILLKVRHD